MRRPLFLALSLAALLSGSTLAATLSGSAHRDDPSEEGADGSSSSSGDEASSSSEQGTDEVLQEETVTHRKPPPLKIQLKAGMVEEDYPEVPLSPEELAEYNALLYPLSVYRGARILGLEPEFVEACRQGLEYIYERDYKAAKSHFDQLSSQYQQSALGPIGTALIWQALMVENFDFKYETQYRVAFEEARRRLEEEIAQPGNEAWEQFLLGGILGLDAVQTMRKGDFLAALQRGFEAIRALGRCREAAPDFADVSLGFGIYNYWRSVVTMTSKFLPSFGDHREEGIQQMLESEKYGIFVRAPSSLSLAFSYLEEHELKYALGYTAKVHRHYPKNVINNLLLARILVYMRRYARAEQVLKDILRDVPDNERSHYYLALVYARERRLDDAIAEMETYLRFDLIDEYRAKSLYRLGNFHYRKHEYKKAESYYKEAWKRYRHRGAKRRLERIKRLRKQGRI